MKPVIIESPFAGNDYHTQAEHEEYLERCLIDCLLRGETPYASHRMLTGALNDDVPHERELGIKAGIAMAAIFGHVVVYTDYGISRGMHKGLAAHEESGRNIEFRQIGRNP